MITSSLHSMIALTLLAILGSSMAVPQFPANVSTTNYLSVRSENSAKPTGSVNTEGIPSASDNPSVYVDPSFSNIDNTLEYKEHPPAYDDSTTSQPVSGKVFPDMITSAASSLYRASQARGYAKLVMFQSASGFRNAPQHAWIQEGYAKQRWLHNDVKCLQKLEAKKLPQDPWVGWTVKAAGQVLRPTSSLNAMMEESLELSTVSRLLPSALMSPRPYVSRHVEFDRKGQQGSSPTLKHPTDEWSGTRLIADYHVGKRKDISQQGRVRNMVYNGGIVVIDTIEGEMSFPTSYSKYGPRPSPGPPTTHRPGDLLANEWRRPSYRRTGEPPGTFSPYELIFTNVRPETVSIIREAYATLNQKAITRFARRTAFRHTQPPFTALLGTLEGTVAAEMLLNYFPETEFLTIVPWSDAGWLSMAKDKKINLAFTIKGPDMGGPGPSDPNEELAC